MIDCHHICIEKQPFLRQDVYSTFSSLIFYITNFICPFGIGPNLYVIDIQMKTVYLGGPRTKLENNSQEMKQFIYNKTGTWPENSSIEIKEWTKMIARKICLLRNDLLTYNILENSIAKMDEDCSDTTCYEFGWITYICGCEKIRTPFDKKIFYFLNN